MNSNHQKASYKPAVLIVDDQQDNIKVLGNFLWEQYRILVAHNGVRALEIAFGKVTPDVILLDIIMPGMDGYEVCKRLKADERTRNIPVIFVTGKDQDRDEELGFLLGAADYITKPVNPHIVRSRVRNQVDLKLRTDMLEQAAMERSILLDNIQTQVWYLINEYTYGLVNKSHADFCGMKMEDMAYKNMHEIFNKGIVSVCRQSNVEVFSTGRQVRTEEWIPNASGQQRLLSIIKSPKIGKNGLVEFVVCSADDITDLKQAEQEREAFAAVVENSDNIIVVKDLDLRVMATNSAFARASGHSSYKDLIGKTDAEIFGVSADEEPVRTYMEDERKAQMLPRGKVIVREEPVIQPDGEVRTVLTRKYPIFDSDGKLLGTGNISADITERRHIEEQLRQANEKLERLNAEKDKLFSIICHDLRSPMSGLISSTEMLSSQLEVFSPDDISYISNELHKNAKTTFALLEELLQWAQMSQGGIDYNPELCNLNELVTIGLNSVKNVAQNKNIRIDTELPDDLVVRVDQSMIKTVIRNLLFNALKFSHHGGQVFVRAFRIEDRISMTVQDNGTGMCKKVQSLIFSVDKAKRQPGTDGEKGTGLGLLLCKQFIEKHGEKIWVESRQGEGTTIFFTLPKG